MNTGADPSTKKVCDADATFPTQSMLLMVTL
jgi:hypothetical protein